MKKWMLLLCTLLLLTGCGAHQKPAPTQENLSAPAEPEALPHAPPEPVPGAGPASEPETEAEQGSRLVPEAETEQSPRLVPEAEADPEPNPTLEPDPPDLKQETVDKLLAEMTLEEKVGQLFFARCPTAGAAEDIGVWHLGGYLLFTRDFKDSAGEWLSAADFVDKITGYQQAAAIPLLIGVDEEGGTVARASRNPYLFPEKRKSPQKVYAQGGMAAIEKDTLEINSHLLSLGINVNFAPVADVSTNSADFMYDRSFGQDAQATAEYVRTVVTAVGIAAARDDSADPSPTESLYKMGCVLKHFPGYGDNRDTHSGVAIDQRRYEQFLEQDFLPFQAGIEAGAGAVLVSHNVVECMDPDLPASLSPQVHRILREELGFSGAAITDDLDMDAVKSYAREGSAAVLAVLAGNDMIITSDYAGQITQILEGVEDGRIDRALIDQAAARVLGWKYDLGLFGGIYD